MNLDIFSWCMQLKSETYLWGSFRTSKAFLHLAVYLLYLVAQTLFSQSIMVMMIIIFIVIITIIIIIVIIIIIILLLLSFMMIHDDSS